MLQLQSYDLVHIIIHSWTHVYDANCAFFITPLKVVHCGRPLIAHTTNHSACYIIALHTCNNICVPYIEMGNVHLCAYELWYVCIMSVVASSAGEIWASNHYYCYLNAIDDDDVWMEGENERERMWLFRKWSGHSLERDLWVCSTFSLWMGCASEILWICGCCVRCLVHWGEWMDGSWEFGKCVDLLIFAYLSSRHMSPPTIVWTNPTRCSQH